MLTVDSHSRITLTKRFKHALSIKPFTKVMVYRDDYNKAIVFHVQSEDVEQKSISTWIMTKSSRDRFNSPFTLRSSLSTASSGFENNEKNNRIRSIDGDDGQYNRLRYNDTLSSTPILLVEDESDILHTFARALKSEGYSNIMTFSDSREVLRHIVDPKNLQYYRLVISDIRMPDINGMKLYQILKILNPSIRALFVTALDAVEEVTSIYPEIRPKDIIRKPVSLEQFVNIVNNKVSSIISD